MFEITEDRQSFSFLYDETGNYTNIAKIIEFAQNLWPGILTEEMEINASARTHQCGDIDQKINVNPSKIFLERIRHTK